MITEINVIRTGGEQGMWTAYALNTFFGPHLAELTECSAPDVPAMPPYLIRYAANRASFSTVNNGHRKRTILTASFIRHSASAIIEYRDGVAALRRYLAILRDPSLLHEHDLAVARFQNCLLQASAGQSCFNALRRIDLPNSKLFKGKDGSIRQRLNELANRVRHFHGDVDDAAKDPESCPWVAPIWITNTGLAARTIAQVHSLAFSELAAFLLEVTAEAKAMSELPFTVP